MKRGHSGNHDAYGRLGNAGGGAGAADTRSRRGTGSGNPAPNQLVTVEETPVDGVSFTFERVSSGQCESNVQYPVEPDSDEHAFYMHWCQMAMLNAHQMSHEHLAEAPQHPIIQLVAERADSATVEFQYISYAQLKLVSRKEALQPCFDWYHPDHKPGIYEQHNDYVVNPDGQLYKIQTKKALPYAVEYCLTIDLGVHAIGEDEGGRPDVLHAVRLQCKGLPKDYALWDGRNQHPYLDMKLKQHSIKVEYGEMYGSMFQPWSHRTIEGIKHPACIYIGDKDIVVHLSKQDLWKAPPPEAPEGTPLLDPNGTNAPYQLDNKDHCFSRYEKRGREEAQWIRMANFAIDGVVQVLEFRDKPHVPIYRLKVHRLMDVMNEDALQILPEDNHMPSNELVGRVDVEVNVPVGDLRDHRDVYCVFAKASSYLICNDKFTPGILRAYLDTICADIPPPTQVCTYFGLQDNTPMFVMGNVTFDWHGEVRLLKDSNVTIYAEYFDSEKNKMLNMPKSDFPRVLIVEQPWVRYTLFFMLWNQSMPTMLLNNVIPAKCMLACSVMQIFASKFWKGESIGHALGSAWAKSGPGTGKTEILEIINGLVGFFERGLWQGESSSLPAICCRLTNQSGLSLCLDEFITIAANDTEKSKKIKDITHSCYDKSIRANMHYIQKPRTGYIATSNILVNETDDAFMQRILLIAFSRLDTSNVDASKSAQNTNQWSAMKKAVSCLLPDFATILHNGELDKEALNDCCTFMNECSGVLFNRNSNLWGFLLYYLLNLNFLAQAFDEEYDHIFEYVCKTSVQQNYLNTKHSSVIDQFILAFEKAREISNPAADPRTAIHWHNFRTLTKPEGYKGLTAVRYYSFRLDSVLKIIHSQLGIKFKKDELVAGIKEASFCDFSRGKFYDPQKGGGAYACKELLPETDDGSFLPSVRVPLPEAELIESTLVYERALFILASEYDKVVTDAFAMGGRSVKDYHTISIKSAFTPAGVYNFYNAVTGRSEGGWYGFRAASQSAFASFCGATNEILFLRDAPPEGESMFDPVIEELQAAEGWQPILQCFDPRYLLQMYNFEDFADPDKLPPCFRYNPFRMRNGPGDNTDLAETSPKKHRRETSRSDNLSPVAYPEVVGSSRRPLASTSPSVQNKHPRGGKRKAIGNPRRSPYPMCPRHPKTYSTMARPWYTVDSDDEQGEDLRHTDDEDDASNEFENDGFIVSDNDLSDGNHSDGLGNPWNSADEAAEDEVWGDGAAALGGDY